MGRFANWLLHKFTMMSKSDLSEFEKMAHELHYAELTSKLTQTESELTAAMEGLRAIRHETEELQTFFSQSRKSKV